MKLILNFKFQISNSNKGFTLIEALITLAILGVIGFILADIISRGFRSTNKTQILGVIKQNGQNALNIMDQTIRGSEAILCTDATGSRIVIIKQPKYVRYSIFRETTTANGYITQETLPVSVPPPNDTETTQYCNPTSNSSDLTVLTDRNPLNGASVKSGSFKRASGNGGKDSVLIEFTLGPGIKAGPAYHETANSVNFKTTVQLR